MPTENPKISAYVPQAVFDRFIQFKEERGLSISQTVIEILVDYFGIDLSKSSTEKNTSGIPDRITILEKELADLKQSYVWLVQKVESIQTTSEPLKSGFDNKPVDIHSDSLIEPLDGTLIATGSEPPSEPSINGSSVIPSEPENELPIIKHLTEQESKLVDNSSPQGIPKSGIPNLSPHQLEIVESVDNKGDNLLSNPPSGLDIKLNYALLAQRLDATEGYLKNKKSTSSPEEFTEWSTKKDPDKISWQSIKQGKSVYHCPIGDLSDQQKTNLQDWLSKIQTSVG